MSSSRNSGRRFEVRRLVRRLARRMEPAAASRARRRHVDPDGRRRRADDRRSAREDRMLSADVDEDDRDVVGRTAVQRLLRADCRPCVQEHALGQHLGHVRLVDDTGQPVRAQQPAVARLGRHDERVDLGVGVHVAEHPHEDRAPRVVPRLFRRDPPRVDQALDERVVGRDLGERVVAVQVDPRVADVRDDRVLVDHDQGAHRRAHAGELGADPDRVAQLSSRHPRSHGEARARPARSSRRAGRATRAGRSPDSRRRRRRRVRPCRRRRRTGSNRRTRSPGCWSAPCRCARSRRSSPGRPYVGGPLATSAVRTSWRRP